MTRVARKLNFDNYAADSKPKGVIDKINKVTSVSVGYSTNMSNCLLSQLEDGSYPDDSEIREVFGLPQSPAMMMKVQSRDRDGSDQREEMEVRLSDDDKKRYQITV